MKYLLKLAVVAAALVPFQAQAQVVNFGGSVLNTCTITVNSGGTLAPDVGNNNLNSVLGSPGSATVVSTGPDFDLAVSDSGFSGPTTPDSTSTSFDSSGANSATGTTFLPLTTAGTNTVSVDYYATSAAGFSTGTYTSQATLTCSE